MQRRIWKKGLILGDTPPHSKTNCNHIFIEDTCIKPQKRMVVKFYFGGSYILQFVFYVKPYRPLKQNVQYLRAFYSGPIKLYPDDIRHNSSK